MGYRQTQWGADWEGGFLRKEELMVSRDGWIWNSKKPGLDVISTTLSERHPLDSQDHQFSLAIPKGTPP
jgi:hypothetical protein